MVGPRQHLKEGGSEPQLEKIKRLRRARGKLPLFSSGPKPMQENHKRKQTNRERGKGVGNDGRRKEEKKNIFEKSHLLWSNLEKKWFRFFRIFLPCFS